MRRTFKANPLLSQPRTMELSDEGLTLRTETFSSVRVWSHFLFFYETPIAFLLFDSSRSAEILPKRAFATPDQLNEFRAFAQSHIGNSPIGFPVQPSRLDSFPAGGEGQND